MPQPVAPVVDPAIDPAVVADLLPIAVRSVGRRPATTVRVGFSDVRSPTLHSVCALVVAPPLWTVVEYRVGRNGGDQPVSQTYRLDAVSQVVESGGNTYAVVESRVVDSSTIGFQVEGPLVGLPYGTEAHELLDPLPTTDGT